MYIDIDQIGTYIFLIVWIHYRLDKLAVGRNV